jgi:hypothetical protein
MEPSMTRSQPLTEALQQPNGARFYRCALQVNPFAYHGRHGRQSIFATEAEYNAAIVDACLREGVEAIAVTDHFRMIHGDLFTPPAIKAFLFLAVSRHLPATASTFYASTIPRRMPVSNASSATSAFTITISYRLAAKKIVSIF